MKKIITLFALSLSICAISQTIALPVFATGFASPVDIEHAGDARLFVVEQGGAIKIVNPDGSVNATNFLTLTAATISTGGERGLLGLAFHPNYATNGYFYVNYTRAGDGATIIARYAVSANPNIANTTGLTLLTIDQPFSNHNGGTIKFGPEGYLYIGMGDGGNAGDPGNRAQNINENLGKMLRIDVNNGTLYANPSDNPYVGVAGNDEIWAIGLRNPWKFSFDRNTGDLWIGDVGQNQIEEINHVPSTTPGINYGWKCYEGNNVYSICTTPGVTYTYPVASYPHSGGACSVTGGYVYSGSTYSNFQNKYFFADYCVNRIGMVNVNTNAITYSATFTGDNYFTTFGEDLSGELYVAASATGKIHRITDTSLGANEFNKMGFSISPNPASSEVMIRFTNASLPAEIRIFDITGKLLLNQNLDANTSAVQTNSLQSGMYVVRVQDNAGAVYSTKLSIE